MKINKIQRRKIQSIINKWQKNLGLQKWAIKWRVVPPDNPRLINLKYTIEPPVSMMKSYPAKHLISLWFNEEKLIRIESTIFHELYEAVIDASLGETIETFIGKACVIKDGQFDSKERKKALIGEFTDAVHEQIDKLEKLFRRKKLIKDIRSLQFKPGGKNAKIK